MREVARRFGAAIPSAQTIALAMLTRPDSGFCLESVRTGDTEIHLPRSMYVEHIMERCRELYAEMKGKGEPY